MLWQVGGVVDSVVELGSGRVSVSSERRGGRNNKYKSKHMHDDA